MEKHCVEVEGLNGAFYEAHIKNITDNILEVVYDNNPQLQFSVRADCVRQIPPPNSYYRITVGDEVEVYSTSCDEEPFGWWLAQVRVIVGEWLLVEYMAGGQEFVLPKAIRSCNQNQCGAIEALARSHQSEQREVSLQVTEQCHAMANEDFTEELWESEEGRRDWHLTVPPPPPKTKKSARRRRKGKKPCIEYTMEDEYDDEEVRMTPNGNQLYRLFGSQWVKM